MTTSTWQIYLFCACRPVYAAGMFVALSYVCPQQFTNIEARSIKHIENCCTQLYYFVLWTGNESYKVSGGPCIFLVYVIMRVNWSRWDTPGTESVFIEKYVVSQAALAVVFRTLCNMSFIDWPQAQEDTICVLFWVSVHRYLICKEGVIFCNCVWEVQRSQLSLLRCRPHDASAVNAVTVLFRTFLQYHLDSWSSWDTWSSVAEKIKILKVSSCRNEVTFETDC